MSLPYSLKHKPWVRMVMSQCGLEHYIVVLGEEWECRWIGHVITVDNNNLEGYSEYPATTKILRDNGIYHHRMSQFKVSFLHECAHALTEYEISDHGPFFNLTMLGLMMRFAPKRARKQKRKN